MKNYDALKRDYDRDGFVVLRGYLSIEDVEVLRDRAIPLVKELMETEGGQGRYRNILKSLHRHDDWFEQQLSEGKHVPLMRRMLGGEICGATAAWFDRPEGDELGIEPHVDAIGRDKVPDAGATIWIALDPVNVQNGCVHYLRGSHKKQYVDNIPIPDVDVLSEDVFAAELEPGDAVVHNALTVHWSYGNTTSKPRRAISYFYFGARAADAILKRKEA